VCRRELRLVDRPGSDAKHCLDLVLERKLLLLREHKEGAHLRFEPPPPRLVLDLVELALQRLELGPDLRTAPPGRRRGA
jgi:hypothetical protein